MNKNMGRAEEPGELQSKSNALNHEEPFELLRLCSARRSIAEWNAWRQDGHQGTVNLGGHSLSGFNLEGADLRFVILDGAMLHGTHLEGADLFEAHLKRTEFHSAHLEGATLCGVHIEDAEFYRTHIQDADFSRAMVNGGTLIHDCKINERTKFEAVGFESMRIYPREKQLLEYNIRRLNWEDWYAKHRVLQWITWPFWWISDYGLSTLRIVGTFFGLAVLFALIYYINSGLIYNLHETGASYSNLIRACYFSIVTMTTLGFGDMYANPGSLLGHILLIIQVMLGYILLAALVTRFAVMFSAGGPAGSFSKRNDTRTKMVKGEESNETINPKLDQGSRR